MEILYLIIGLLIGGIASYLVAKNKYTAINDSETSSLKAQVQQCQYNAVTVKADAEARIAEIKRDSQNAVAAIKAECYQTVQLTKKEAKEQREAELHALQTRYDSMLQQLKAEVTITTERVLKQRSTELQQENSARMDQIFTPIKDNLARMQNAINESRVSNAQYNTHFEDLLRQMMDSNAKIGQQADRLSTALQRKNKIAGNWGELILTELLESQGLKPGLHFDVQQTIKDETGRTVLNEDSGSRMIPDVVMHLGDDRDVVIDSKMSLTAFVDYQNAESEVERHDALARHIESIRSHIKELSAKDYSSYIAGSGTSIDFVIMFVPIDSALQLVINEVPTLWREAFEKRVFIASAQTLTAALHIIRMTWVSIQQERNTQRIMNEARMLIDRVGLFYRDFLTVDKRLDEVSKAFAAIKPKVEGGRQSIMSIANHLEDLGVHGKKPLPR